MLHLYKALIPGWKDRARGRDLDMGVENNESVELDTVHVIRMQWMQNSMIRSHFRLNLNNALYGCAETRD